MLSTLSFEIILNVCSHLEYNDKLNLKLTCQQLNDSITKAILYEDFHVIINNNNNNNGKPMRRDKDHRPPMIKDKRLDGSLVKVLHINMQKLHSSTKTQLSTFFPNVTRVITSEEPRREDPIRLYYPPGPGYRGEPLPTWRNTIETIVSCQDWNTLTSDLVWSRYSRLTELDFGTVDDKLRGWVNDDSVSFFTNMPLLKKLTLRDARINLEVLEAIHAGSPLLESLRLFNPVLFLKDDTLLPQSMVPASSVVYLGLFNSSVFNRNRAMLDYILRKYTHLKQLFFGVNLSSDYFIKTPNNFVKDPGEDDFAYDQMVAARIARSQTEFPIYSAMESNFYSNLPNSLKTLTLKINNIDNAVAALAESNSKITYLNLLDGRELYTTRDSIFGDKYKRIWKDPNMLENFNKLTSLKVLKIPLGSSALDFTPECISSTITRLVIGLCEDTFSIEWVLSKFPSLDELEINPPECNLRDTAGSCIKERDDEDSHDGNGNIKRGQPIIKEYRKLRILSINKCIIHPSFFSFIKRAVPNLNVLDLNMCLPKSPETYKVDLSNWDLNKCDLSFDSSTYSPTISCVITIQDVSGWFEITSSGYSLVPVGRYHKYNQRNAWVEVIADHIKHLRIIDFPVIKLGDKIVIDLFQ